VNDYPHLSDDFETDLFANDKTSYCADPNLDQLFTKVQNLINDISTWSRQNGLTIHPTKSTVMMLSPRTFTGPFPFPHHRWKSNQNIYNRNMSRSQN
jgi:hypothetical protein